MNCNKIEICHIIGSDGPVHSELQVTRIVDIVFFSILLSTIYVLCIVDTGPSEPDLEGTTEKSNRKDKNNGSRFEACGRKVRFQIQI